MDRFSDEDFLNKILECENTCNRDILKELIDSEHEYMRNNVLECEDGRITFEDTKIGERMRKIIQVCNSHLEWYETFLGELCKSDIRLVRCLCAGAVDMNRTEFFEEQDPWVFDIWKTRHEFVDWYYNISGMNPISAESKEMIDWLASNIGSELSIVVNDFYVEGIEINIESELLENGKALLPMDPNYYFISDEKTLAWMLNKLREHKFVKFKEGVLPKCFDEPMTEPLPFVLGEKFPRCFGTKCLAWMRKRRKGPHTFE